MQVPLKVRHNVTARENYQSYNMVGSFFMIVFTFSQSINIIRYFRTWIPKKHTGQIIMISTVVAYTY